MLIQEGDLFRVIVSYSTDAIMVVDLDGVVRFLNPAAERLFARPAGEIIGQMFGYPIYSDKVQEINVIRPDADHKVVEMRVSKAELRGESLYVVSMRDITELARLREELHIRSITDGLTGLYNRLGFQMLAQQQFNLAKRTKRAIFLLYVDVDDLKYINDTLGHREGDRALKDTAAILKKTFRESDIVARIGGDEFAVLMMEAFAASKDIVTFRLKENLETCITQENNRKYRLSLSFGIGHYDPASPCTIDNLIAQADALMYSQKKRKQFKPAENKEVNRAI